MTRNAQGKQDNDRATANKGAQPLSSPAHIGVGRHETSKVCVKATRGRGLPNTKRHTEKHKRHTTPQNTRKGGRGRQAAKRYARARTPSGPPQAQQGIAKEADHKQTTTHRRACRRTTNCHKRHAAALQPESAF